MTHTVSFHCVHRIFHFLLIYRYVFLLVHSRDKNWTSNDSTLFPRSQFDLLYDVPEQCEIEMSIDKQSGKITMEGLKEEVHKAKDKIFELLRKFQKERWLDEEAKLVADTVQWSVMVCKFPQTFHLN